MAFARNCSADDHCCYLNGQPCDYLTRDDNTRKWACGLLLKYNTWEEVYKTQEYMTEVKPKLEEIRPGMDCNDFPFKGERCHTCRSIGE